MTEKKPFAQKTFFDDDHLIGARWWQEGFLFLPDPQSRRDALKKLAIGGGVLAGGWGLLSLIQWASTETFEEALALQRAEGWDVGATSDALSFSDVVTAPVEPMLPSSTPLSTVMRPRQSRLMPYYVPTLFQALESSSNTRLRQLMKLTNTQEMKDAYQYATAMRELLSAPLVPEGLGVIVDMPGPAAVAFAAGLCGVYDAVFLFDNWPHPKGVVPAHTTLSAALYYEPYFRKQTPLSGDNKLPPLFVLDANRLNSYTEEQDKFDNRYVAKLPSAQNLKELGVKRLLYINLVGKAPFEESDDINGDFVEYQKAGIDIKLFELKGNFSAASPTTAPTSVAAASGPVIITQNQYYFRGSPAAHPHFWAHYGWAPVPVGFVLFSLPGATYTPRPRATLFSSSGTGTNKSRPKSYGKISSSSSTYRSGSVGRSYSSSGS